MAEQSRGIGVEKDVVRYHKSAEVFSIPSHLHSSPQPGLAGLDSKGGHSSREEIQL